MPSNEKLRQKNIENLQYAALTLIKLIDNKLKDKDDEKEGKDAEKEGVFRLSPFSDSKRKTIVAEIEQGKIDFTGMTLLQCAQVLKSILGALQDNNEPLFSSDEFDTLNDAKKKNENYVEVIKNVLKGKPESTQKIAFFLLTMLKNVANNKKTGMTSLNLGRMIGPNLFPMLDFDLSSLAKVNRQNEICEDLINNASSLSKPKFNLLSTHYEAQVKNVSENRFHLFNATSKQLGDAYKEFKGDLLKSQILLNFKKRLEETTLESLDQEVKKLIETPEYEVLATSQGVTTWFLGFFGRGDTSSVKAFREMVEERKGDLKFEQGFVVK